MCKKLHYTKVLIVEELENNISIEESFKLACTFDYDAFAELKVAFIDLLPKRSEVNAFTAKMKVSRGLDMKLFDGVPAAKDWLVAG